MTRCHYANGWSNCDPLVNVQDVKWLQSITSLPILVKGVVTTEDGELLQSLLLLLQSPDITLS